MKQNELDNIIVRTKGEVDHKLNQKSTVDALLAQDTRPQISANNKSASLNSAVGTNSSKPVSSSGSAVVAVGARPPPAYGSTSDQKVSSSSGVASDKPPKSVSTVFKKSSNSKYNEDLIDFSSDDDSRWTYHMISHMHGIMLDDAYCVNYCINLVYLFIGMLFLVIYYYVFITSVFMVMEIYMQWLYDGLSFISAWLFIY